MKFKFRKTACLLAALCCCTAFTATGCSGSEQDPDNKTRAVTTAKEIPGVEVYAPEVPKDKIDENVPGKNLDAVLNTEAVYDNKISTKLTKVIELDFAKKDDRRVLIAEMSITNKSNESIDCSELTHFSAKVDGTEQIELVRDVKAAINARKYYSRTGGKLQPFNQKIAAGETVEGYVYMAAPGTWKDLELVYIPYKYFSNDTITFKIKDSDITHYDVNLDLNPQQPPSEQYTGTTTAAASSAAADTTASAAADTTASAAADTTASAATDTTASAAADTTASAAAE